MNWFYESNGSTQGPVMESGLESLWLNGLLNGDTFVWREGLAGWIRAGEIWPALISQKPETISRPLTPVEAVPAATLDPIAASVPEAQNEDYCESTDSWEAHPVKPAKEENHRLHGLGYLAGGIVTVWAGVAWPLHQINTGAASVMVPMKMIIVGVLIALLGIYMTCTGKSLSHYAKAEHTEIMNGSITKVPPSMWLFIGFIASIGLAVIWYIDAYFAKLGYS